MIQKFNSSPPSEADVQETAFLDFNHPSFQGFKDKFNSDQVNSDWLKETYVAVRDYQLYDPYHLDLRPNALKASTVITKPRAWCVEKAIVLASLFRAYGIPTRLGYATVINHLDNNRLEKYLLRPEITFHGYVCVYFNERWTRCTPAFDRRVCRIQGVPPLEWVTTTDSLFQQEITGGRFMEYIQYYGEFSDVPIDLMESEMRAFYPHLFLKPHESKSFSFFHRDSI